jgi:hypothetical protein
MQEAEIRKLVPDQPKVCKTLLQWKKKQGVTVHVCHPRHGKIIFKCGSRGRAHTQQVQNPEFQCQEKKDRPMDQGLITLVIAVSVQIL